MGDFKKLHVWRKAHALALNAHRIAGRIRGSEHSSLRSQMIRAALSIPTNIVEGKGQRSELDQCRFLRYAVNSSSELEYHLIVGRDLSVISSRDFDSLVSQVIEVRRMIHGLMNYLSAKKASEAQEGLSQEGPSVDGLSGSEPGA
jgi:four helix bundle protein